MNFYSPEYYKALDADLIIERGNDTFLCYRRRTPYVAESDARADHNWKIALYRTTEESGTKTTQLLFPHGRDTYDYSPNDIESLPFRFLV